MIQIFLEHPTGDRATAIGEVDAINLGIDDEFLLTRGLDLSRNRLSRSSLRRRRAARKFLVLGRLRGRRGRYRFLGRGRRLVDIRRKKQHQTHQQKRQQETHLHGEFFFLTGFVAGLDWNIFDVGHSCGSLLTNRVEPALPEGMAAQQAAKSQPDAARGAVFRNRFEHIFRARGMVAASRWQVRGKESFVETQCRDHCFPHRVTNRSNSRPSSSGVAFNAARRGLITISHCGAISWKRIRSTSRIRLFTRFRSTAFPKARGTVNPSLGPSPAWRGTCRQNAAKYGLAIRVPWVYALRKSEVLRIRALFGKPNLFGVP